jgi:transposase
MFLSRNTKKEDAMDSLPQHGERNYLPHLYETRLHSCRRIRESNWPMRKVLSYYHVKRPSVYRWLKRYDELGEDDLINHSTGRRPSTLRRFPHQAAYKVLIRS